MDSKTYQRASRIFQRVVDLPPDSRESFLEESCGGDEELITAVRLLLENDRDSSSDDVFDAPLARLGPAPEGDSEVSQAEGFPRPFGRYTLLRLIGRGGMGVVYEAEQDRPRQRVALKLMARHAISRVSLARFRREAEVLGRLRHPGIAEVFDAGEISTDEGAQPFLALELIKGQTIVRHAIDHGLDTKARINLMADVCDAVHHAHESGVIHRDLKPDNVLVTERGAVKVLDFGIAHVSGELEAEGSLMTVEGQVIGTLNYMSPEQLRGTTEAVGAHSDVYSLGVMLFELLAERTPHDLRNRSIVGAARYLEANEPPPLSKVQPRYRGDLTTIVAKALARDVGQRYPTAAALGADLLRYWRDEPIHARPSSLAYRMSKFVRRNRLLVGAGSVTFLALSAGTSVATWQAITARRAQHEAEQSEIGAIAVSDFLIKEILTADTPDVAQGETITLQEAFERAAENLHELDAQPEVQASLYHTLGEAFRNLGEWERAHESFERALDWRSEELGEDHEDSVDSLLGLCSATKGLRSYEAALPLQLRAYELSLAARGSHHEQTREAWNNLGSLYHKLERYEDAEKALRGLIADLDATGDTEVLLRFEAMHSLSIVMTANGDWEEADVHIRGAAQGKTRLLGELHPSTLTSVIAAGINTYRRQEFEQAAEELAEVLPRAIQVWGEDHPSTTSTREYLCNAIISAELNLGRAEGHLRHVIALRLDDPYTNLSQLAHDYALLGVVLLDRDELVEARESFDEAVGRFGELREDHPGIAWTREWIQKLEQREAELAK